MSDKLTHECGIALVRLRKPLSYYYEKYGTTLWGFNKLFLLMEKQHNRGQDGVGIGCVKLNVPLGDSYMHRRRDAKKDCLAYVFNKEVKAINKKARLGGISLDDAEAVKKTFDFGGEVLMGHLRYGTSGEFDEGACHPYVRRSNWPTKTLMVMGNFNMTNTADLNRKLIGRGQHPVFGTDTQTVLEEIGFHLDEMHNGLYRELKSEVKDGREIPQIISERIDIPKVLSESAASWDGGYAICGSVGNGDLFFMRDPKGIRPCHYFINDEVVAVASERVPLMTVFEECEGKVKELQPGHCVTVSHHGEVSEETPFSEKVEPEPCSFERIYFSRGNDPEIYQQRKRLGEALAPQVLKSIGGDMTKAVVSFVPNTAETAYYGLLEGLRIQRRREVKELILDASKKGELNESFLDEFIMNNWPRSEKIAHKDIKMRTFITQEKNRAQLVSHVYDITYGVVKADDSLVVLDDSIVRGTTLKKSILKILTRTQPRKIVICSTAPQIRYPDCYGIDMSELGKFIAFQAAVSLLKKKGQHAVLKQVYENCQEELTKEPEDMINVVKEIYSSFTDEEISHEISLLVSPENNPWTGEIDVFFQSVENLHKALGGQYGDWYFTGDYPTPGGFATVNQAYIHWFEGSNGRSY